MLRVAVALQMLISAGWAEPQAGEITRYFWAAAGGPPSGYSLNGMLDVCTNTVQGEGLVDVTGKLRGELHRFAGVRSLARLPSGGCTISAETQIAFLVWAFPHFYPESARRFNAGDLGKFPRAWGRGVGN